MMLSIVVYIFFFVSESLIFLLNDGITFPSSSPSFLFSNYHKFDCDVNTISSSLCLFISSFACLFFSLPLLVPSFSFFLSIWFSFLSSSPFILLFLPLSFFPSLSPFLPLFSLPLSPSPLPLFLPSSHSLPLPSFFLSPLYQFPMPCVSPS